MTTVCMSNSLFALKYSLLGDTNKVAVLNVVGLSQGRMIYRGLSTKQV